MSVDTLLGQPGIMRLVPQGAANSMGKVTALGAIDASGQAKLPESQGMPGADEKKTLYPETGEGRIFSRTAVAIG